LDPGGPRTRALCYLLSPMPTDIRAQFRDEFERARDEYIVANKAHANALAAALTSEADEVNREYERASADLIRKQEAYRRATDNLRGLSSRATKR